MFITLFTYYFCIFIFILPIKIKIKIQKYTQQILFYIIFSILQIALDDLGKVFAIEIYAISQRTSKKHTTYIALCIGYF